MKTIIAGSRRIHDYNVVLRAIKASGFDITEVVSGKADGVDTLGEKWANENNIHIEPFEVTKKDWNTYGKRAGPRRNGLMADYGEALIAIPCPKSKGTKDMIVQAQRKGLEVYVHEELIKETKTIGKGILKKVLK